MKDRWTDSDELKMLARHINERTNRRIALTTYSPGDGVTRYRLGIGHRIDTPNLAPGYLHDYFGDRALCTALGRKEACLMLRAFLDGANEGNT